MSEAPHHCAERVSMVETASWPKRERRLSAGIEIKADRGRPTVAQCETIAAMEAAGAYWLPHE